MLVESIKSELQDPDISCRRVDLEQLLKDQKHIKDYLKRFIEANLDRNKVINDCYRRSRDQELESIQSRVSSLELTDYRETI